MKPSSDVHIIVMLRIIIIIGLGYMSGYFMCAALRLTTINIENVYGGLSTIFLFTAIQFVFSRSSQ